MSERAAMVGDAGSPHRIVHNGKTYTVKRVVTEEVMDAVEMKLYDRAKQALYGQRDMMPEATYERKLDELRALFVKGEYAFESDATAMFLKTKPGVLLLLECMMDASTADILVLMAERGVELHGVLKDVLALSFPKEASVPKERGRRPEKRKGRRRR